MQKRTTKKDGKIIEFVVIGKIQAWQRPGKSRAGIRYTPDQTRNWKQQVAITALKYKPKQLWSGPIEAQLIFLFPKPKSYSKKIMAHITKPDVDNLAKSILDALQKIIYKRDQQIVKCMIEKSYVESDVSSPMVYIKLILLEHSEFKILTSYELVEKFSHLFE